MKAKTAVLLSSLVAGVAISAANESPFPYPELKSHFDASKTMLEYDKGGCRAFVQSYRATVDEQNVNAGLLNQILVSDSYREDDGYSAHYSADGDRVLFMAKDHLTKFDNRLSLVRAHGGFIQKVTDRCLLAFNPDILGNRRKDLEKTLDRLGYDWKKKDGGNLNGYEGTWYFAAKSFLS